MTTTYTDDKQSIAYSIGKMGANGADAKLLYLTATAETMNFDADDNPKTTQTITISAKLQNVTGTATFKAIPYIGNAAQTEITLGGSGNDRTLTSAQWTNKQWTMIAITATLNGLTDTLSIVKVNDGKEGEPGRDGEDGNDAQEVFSGYLSNEAIILPANASGTVSDFSKANGSFVTYLGQNQLTSGVAYSLVSQTGITASINATTGVYSVSAASADSGMAVFKAVYQGVTIQKILSVSKSKQGGTGATGKGISSSAVTYQASTSGTTVPSGTWLTSIPSVPANQYLWTKTVTTYSDNTTSTAYSVGKMGANGADGKGVKSTAVTYQASTSGTVTPTGTWLTSIPSVAAGSYLWTKTVITYTDNSTSTSYSIGKMGNTGAQGNPTGVTESTTVPSSPYVGMLWKCTGTPTGYLKNTVYRWNGSKWDIWTFSAVNIIAESFSGITFEGVTMKSSQFISQYEFTDAGKYYKGTQSIGYGKYYNAYETDLLTGSFKISETGDILNQRTDGGELYEQVELTPFGLALETQDFGGVLTAQALTKTPWRNLVYASGYSVAENNNMQYRIIYQPDGSRLIRFRGQFKKSDNSTLPANVSIYPIGDATHTIPKEIHPARTEFGYAATNSGNGGRLAVTNTGMFVVTLASASTYVSISGIQYILD